MTVATELLPLLVVEQKGCKGSAHVPFHVVGQQAQKDVRSDSILVPVSDVADAHVQPLEAAKRPFHLRQSLIGPHHLLGIELFRGLAGTDHSGSAVRSAPAAISSSAFSVRANRASQSSAVKDVWSS